MSDRKMSQDEDCASLLSKLGSDSPRPRMKYGGMFCSVEGAFENKTLSFESFSPQAQRRRAAHTQSDGHFGGDAAVRGGGSTMVLLSGHTRDNLSEREVLRLLKDYVSVPTGDRFIEICR